MERSDEQQSSQCVPAVQFYGRLEVALDQRYDAWMVELFQRVGLVVKQLNTVVVSE